jgi:hypothetical protein
MPQYLGTKTGNTGIPSLLISSLQQVKDPEIQTALYQIQNWANSFHTLLQSSPPGVTLAGSWTNQPLIMTAGTLVATTGTGGSAGQVTLTFPTAFPNGLVSVVAMSGDQAAAGDMLVVGNQSGSPASRSAIVLICLNAGPGTPISGVNVRINWVAVGF